MIEDMGGGCGDAGDHGSADLASGLDLCLNVKTLVFSHRMCRNDACRTQGF